MVFYAFFAWEPESAIRKTLLDNLINWICCRWAVISRLVKRGALSESKTIPFHQKWWWQFPVLTLVLDGFIQFVFTAEQFGDISYFFCRGLGGSNANQFSLMIFHFIFLVHQLGMPCLMGGAWWWFPLISLFINLFHCGYMYHKPYLTQLQANLANIRSTMSILHLGRCCWTPLPSTPRWLANRTLHVPLDTVGNGGMEMVGIGPTKYGEKNQGNLKGDRDMRESADILSM